MSPKIKHFYEFGDFRLDLSEKVLLRDEKAISLTPKVFETLQVLIENAGSLVEKDVLMHEIWQDRFVEESNLTFNIKMLRKALGDNAARPRFIETVPRRGYRFIAEVREASSENGAGKRISQTPDQISANSFAFKQFLFPALTVLAVCAVFIGFWYRSSKTGTASTAPILSAPFASETLSTTGKVFQAVISPDGKNVVYTNAIHDKQSIWLRQLESSNNVEIIPPSDDVYFGLALTPDGNFLYFSRGAKGSEGQADIYRVSIFGGVPQKIVSETQGWMSVADDGARISFVRCFNLEDENCSLWIADADGKNEAKLVSRPRPFRIGDNRISPAGKTIAFAAGQSNNQANEFGLFEVEIESGAEREITPEKFFNIKSLAWLPDKSGLLITASRIPNKNYRIWQVSAATGTVEPLTKVSETYAGLSIDKNAKSVVSTEVKPDFHLRIINTENLSLNRVLADVRTAAFAPDGKIIFSSSMTGNEEIWSINSDSSGQRQLTNDAADESAPIVSAENNSIFFASNRTGAVHVWRMNPDGSNQTQITHKAGGFPLFISPDGNWIYYHQGVDRTLWRAMIRGGEEHPVLNKGKYRFAISPDGLLVAYSERKEAGSILTIASLADGQIVKTFPFADSKTILEEIVWLPDGKGLAYTLSDGENENNTLWLQMLDARAPRQIADLGGEDIFQLAVSPDGKTFGVVQGVWLHDAVLIKGLL